MRRATTSMAMKTTAPTVAPTTTPIGNVNTEEAAGVELWRGVVILNPISLTR